MNQTMALFRYLLSGIVNYRLLIAVSMLYIGGLCISYFIMELAMLNRQLIAAAFLADFLRYSLVLIVLLLTITHVAEDFEYRQFESMLSMPVSRWQYILARFLVIAITALVLVSPCLLVLPFYVSFAIAGYWTIALWLEALMVGLIGFLAILSLEKVPGAVFLTLAVYLLSKLSGLISQMLAASTAVSDHNLANRLVETVLNGILYLLPGLQSFAWNDVYFKNMPIAAMLIAQFECVLIYLLFMLMACLIDFYRKEFTR